MKRRIFLSISVIAILLTSCSSNKIGNSLFANKGSKTSYCNGASTKSPHEHQFSNEWSADDTYHWHDSTCEHDMISNQAEHSFGDWEIETPATEYKVGKERRICSVCSYEEEKDIPAINHLHAYSDDWSFDETHHWHASLCGYDEKRNYEEHTLSDWITKKEPREGIEGLKTRSCSVCGYEEQESIPALETNIYTIQYVLNGGTNDPSNPDTYEEGDHFILRDPTKTGYSFNGWFLTSNFTGERILQVKNYQKDNLVLYASWTIITYEITYYLDGGTNPPSNPSTYTVENGITFADPTKTGYTFLGWFDINENQVTSIVTGTTGNEVLTAHWNDGDSYIVTLNPNGGSVSETTIDVQYDHAYELPTPSRLGYTFDGWFEDSTLIDKNGIWTLTSDKTFEAHWTIISYSITYNLNGGTNDPSNPSTYTVEDNVIFASPTKMGYEFLGWFSNDVIISEISKGTIGGLEVEARWDSAYLNVLSVSSSDVTKGTVSIVSGEGYSDETIVVSATPCENCVFMGWFHNSAKVSENNTYSFVMPHSDYSLEARFLTNSEEEEYVARYATRPVLSEDNKTITYGLYPKTNVNNDLLISELNLLEECEENGWYIYEDDYYVKAVAVPSDYDDFKIKYDNGTIISSGKTYWFKCEPIVWNVLNNNNGELYIISSMLLDANCYYNSTSNRNINNKTIYPNNYEYSDIRVWLNNDFLNSAFALGSDHIENTNVDNKASTTHNSTNQYSCNNTVDKVFLPSYQDYTNPIYGFSASNDPTETRCCTTTDWARAMGARSIIVGAKGYDEAYWTRSPRYNIRYEATLIGATGSCISGSDIRNIRGIRPAITIRID